MSTSEEHARTDGAPATTDSGATGSTAQPATGVPAEQPAAADGAAQAREPAADHDDAAGKRAADHDDAAGEPAADNDDAAGKRAADHDDAPGDRSVGRLLAAVVAMTVAAAFAVTALVVPYLNTAPRGVPVGVTGESASQFGQMLDMLQPGAFEVTSYDDADALREATLDREVYGGFAVEQESATAVVATGGSAVLGQFLSSIGSSLGATVEDVAPGSQQDTTGYGLHVAATVAALAALLGAVAIARAVPRRLGVQLTGVLALAVALGLAVAAVLQAVGSVEGAFVQVAAVTAVAVLAVATPALALTRLGGIWAPALFALVIIVPGMSLSGLTSAPEMLPAGFGTIGQFLPQGAYGSLVQSVAFFGGGGALQPLLVLLGWVVVGALLVWLAVARTRSAAGRAAVEAEIAALEAEADEDEADAAVAPQSRDAAEASGTHDGAPGDADVHDGRPVPGEGAPPTAR
ncbi:hypothetical protein [Georgenia sp. AZ-5]|uniref:hypothetical protein n=1 Tax=Georgenia sp. AZ-5 TaxID=3367526 RepID=UPI003754B775